MEFLAKIRKGRIRIPPTRQFKDGEVVKVTVEAIEKEGKRNK
jgi:hypothetical protein